MEYFAMSVVVALAVILSLKLWAAFRAVVWMPYVLNKHFAKQGMKGPGYSLLTGSLGELTKFIEESNELVLDQNDHDIVKKAVPYYHHWRLAYGETFLHWLGAQPAIFISEVELIKEVLLTQIDAFDKIEFTPDVTSIFGEGLVIVNGPAWDMHKKFVQPAFYTDKIKAMTEKMVPCVESKLEDWKAAVVRSDNQCAKIDIVPQFQDLAAEIISTIILGKEKEALQTQRELMRYAEVYINATFSPGTRYIPTRLNRKVWKLTKNAKNALKSIIEKRLDSKVSDGYGDDLLGLMMGASNIGKNAAGSKMILNDLAGECQALYFAGHETVNGMLTWTMFLLSLEPEWQEKLREEVMRECGTETPNTDQLNKLKLVNMVLLEALRLYWPPSFLIRNTKKDVTLGNWRIPKDIFVVLPIMMVHHDKKYWGEDAHKFNPMRFADGVSKAAKHPNALLAFSMGPRVCTGQNLAMLEGKMVIAMILQRFTFSLSPDYKHAPVGNFTLQAPFGVPILLKSINA